MLLNKSNQNNIPELDPKLAGQMLQNVFDICETESNSIPLEELISYANYRKERFSLQKILLVVIMILFCMLPILFIAPSFTVEEPAEDTYNPIYRVSVDNAVPISYVTAIIDGRNMPVYDAGDKNFTIEPTANGTMTVTVELFNDQYDTRTVEVTTVDTEAPVVTSNYIENNDVYMFLDDNVSGVNYPAIYAVDETGNHLSPASYDEETGCIIFDYPETTLNVYIPDHAENTLHLVLTV